MGYQTAQLLNTVTSAEYRLHIYTAKNESGLGSQALADRINPLYKVALVVKKA